jgi:hypothetical protein
MTWASVDRSTAWWGASTPGAIGLEGRKTGYVYILYGKGGFFLLHYELCQRSDAVWGVLWSRSAVTAPGSCLLLSTPACCLRQDG